MPSTKVPTYQSRRNQPQSTDPLTKAEEIVEATSATLVDPKSDCENYKDVFLQVIRNSGIPDLAWLMEFDPPRVDPQWDWHNRMSDNLDNKISSFLLPELGWQLIADFLSRAAGKKLLAGIEAIKRSDNLEYEKFTSVLQGVIDNFWMLDLLARREPVGNEFSVVDMEWRREFRFLNYQIAMSVNWLSEEEAIELFNFSYYLEAQACPRISDSRTWDSLPESLAYIPKRVRQSQEHRYQPELEGAL